MSDWDEDWGGSSTTTASTTTYKPAAPASSGWDSAPSSTSAAPQSNGNSSGGDDWASGIVSSSNDFGSSGDSGWGSSSGGRGGSRGGGGRGAGGGGCYNCGGSGHMSRDCPEPRKERGGGGGGGSCYNCGGSGHMSRDCPEPRKERGGGGGGGGCYNCGGSGHMSRDCSEPKKERGPGGPGRGGGSGNCFNCGGTGHMSRDCTQPRQPRQSGGFGGGNSGFGGSTSNGGDIDWSGGGSSAPASKPSGGDDFSWGGGDSGATNGNSAGGDDGWGGGSSSGGGFGRSSGGGGGAGGRGCRNCGEDGHFARECPKPRAAPGGGAGGGGGCHNCGEQGHFARECSKPRSASGAGGAPADGPPREHFQPDKEVENEEDLFSAELTIPSGINFEKYEKIEVHVSGRDADQIKPIASFADAGLRQVLQTNVQRANFAKPTPVQKYTIPSSLAKRDVIACAQTGSGKTAAYLLPILHRLLNEEQELLHHASPMSPAMEPSVLVFAPTRELARQITEQCRKFSYGTVIQSQMVYGGINRSYQRERGSRVGCHVLVGTVGRIHDFVRSGDLKLNHVKFLVLDEADRMLDEGFGHEVRQIVNNYGMPTKEDRFTMMFSATMKGDVQRLAADMLRPDYLFLAVGLVGGACDDVIQDIQSVGRAEKVPKLIELLEADGIKEASDSANQSKVLVFCEEKKKADFICGLLNTRGYQATSIHGDRLQSQREQALNDFRSGRRPILVATSVCARGLDIVGVQHVINFDLPKEIDDYVHRIGRTGRCGNTGRATSFYDAERDFGLTSFLVQKLQERGQAVPDFLGSPAGGYGAPSYDNIARDVRSDVHRVVTDDWGNEGNVVPPVAAMAATAISSTGDDDNWG